MPVAWKYVFNKIRTTRATLFSNQYWETRNHYEDYFAWRTKEGVGAELQSLCSEPTSVRFFNDVIEAKAPSTVGSGLL
jgi:hypothetical protein